LAHDCVPSLLTTPLMMAWMFAYEPIEEESIYLLKAVPKKWFETGFLVDKVGTSKGNFNICVKTGEDYVSISISIPKDIKHIPVYLVLRCFSNICEDHIVSGHEYITAYHENRLQLNTKHDSIKIKIKV